MSFFFLVAARPGPLTMINVNNTVPHTGVLLEIRCGGMVGNPPGNFVWYRQRREDSDWVRIHDRNNQTEPFLNTTTCQYYRNSTLYYLLSKSDIDLLIKCSVSNGVGEGYSVEVTGEFGVDGKFSSLFLCQQVSLFQLCNMTNETNNTCDLVGFKAGQPLMGHFYSKSFKRLCFPRYKMYLPNHFKYVNTSYLVTISMI